MIENPTGGGKPESAVGITPACSPSQASNSPGKASRVNEERVVPKVTNSLVNLLDKGVFQGHLYGLPPCLDVYSYSDPRGEPKAGGGIRPAGRINDDAWEAVIDDSLPGIPCPACPSWLPYPRAKVTTPTTTNNTPAPAPSPVSSRVVSLSQTVPLPSASVLFREPHRPGSALRLSPSRSQQRRRDRRRRADRGEHPCPWRSGARRRRAGLSGAGP
jgi:hypothetical protein